MFRVLLAEPLDPESEARLAAGAVVVRAPACDALTLCRLIGDCDALVARTSTPVTRAVLQSGPRLRVVGVAGVGVDRVDVKAAAELGIAVLSTPAAATDAVADLTLALILHQLRPVGRLAAAYRAGAFHAAREHPHGRELASCVVGIVGMGRIGSAVGRRSAACGARVIYNDIVPVGPFDFAATPVEKGEIWERSDIVSLHVPLTEATRRLVDAAALSRFKPGAILVNTSRGAVVDTAALTAALQTKRLGGAALDVVDPEPLPAGHPLFAIDACVLTPHIAARTHEGLRRMFGIVDAVLARLRETETDTSARSPERK